MKCGCPRPGLISQCYLASLMSPVRRFVSLKTRRRSRHPGLGRKLPGFRSSQSGGTFSLVSTIAMSRKRHKRSSESTLRLIWPISLKKSADGSALSWYPVADKRKPRPLRPEGSAALEITLSSFRRFCVAAARWNSSRARSDRVGQMRSGAIHVGSRPPRFCARRRHDGVHRLLKALGRVFHIREELQRRPYPADERTEQEDKSEQ
jgi:hypothetical protein